MISLDTWLNDEQSFNVTMNLITVVKCKVLLILVNPTMDPVINVTSV